MKSSTSAASADSADCRLGKSADCRLGKYRVERSLWPKLPCFLTLHAIFGRLFCF